MTKITVSTCNVKGVCCGKEVPLVKSAITNAFPTVKEIEVNRKASTFTFKHDSNFVSVHDVMAAVTKAGFKSSLRSQEVVEVGGNGGSGGGIATVRLSASGVKDVEDKVDALRGIFSVEKVGADKYEIEYNSGTVSEEAIKAALKPSCGGGGCCSGGSKSMGGHSHDHSHAPPPKKKGGDCPSGCCGDAKAKKEKNSNGGGCSSHDHSHGHSHDHTPSTPKKKSSGCCSSGSCSSKSPPPPPPKSVTALIIDDDLHIYDIAGSHCVYGLEGPSSSTVSLSKVCFSAHSLPADLLTTCFDENFLHGEADETCMCGDEDPHIHAHLTGSDCHGNEMGLTKFKLVPKKEQYKPNFSISGATPKSCNSAARVSAVRTSIKVMHGDHEDYLAIASDGSLLLAHDSDQCCDGTDFHGALSLVSRRQLSNTISMTFFKLDEKEFNILDYVDKIVPSLSKPVVDPRVDAAIGLDKVFSPKNSPNRTNGKSTIHVSNICCASEVPPITETCESLIGVTKVTVNVTNKLVYVYHDYKSLPAISIVDALNYAGFGATLKKDARPKILPPPSDNKTIGKSSFAIANMCCASEVPPIMQILEPLPGVSSVKCNVTAKLVYVEHDFFVITAEKMMDELNKDGFGATIKKNAGKTVTFIASVDSPAVEEPVGVLESFGLPNANVIVCGFLWILSMFAPAFPPPYNQLEDLALLAFAVGIYPIALKTLDSVRRLSMDANLLMFIAAVGAVGLQQFSEAAGLTFLFSLGEWLESRATGKAKRALESIVSLRPDTANRQVVGDGGSTEFVEVPAEYVALNDIVLVKTGDKIPVDGDVVKGESVVDESSLTGESRPVKKKKGSQVFSGTINIGMAPLTVVCTATTENSTVSKLIELVEEAQANRSPTEKLVDEFAKRYTPIVVLSSLLMCTVPFLYGKAVGMEWLERGIVLIVIACPCALIISTPVTYVAGLAATAQKGIVIKGGVHLEALSRVKIVASDKTGTLTHGEFAVLQVDMVGRWKKRKEVLRCLAVMERESSHPMASALVQKARTEGVELTERDQPSEHEILKGEGVQGVVDGKRMYVGNQRLMVRLGFMKSATDEVKRKARLWGGEGGTVGFMGVEGVGIVAMFVVADKVRDESRGAIMDLKDMGIDVYMLTGDGEGAANAVANKVGLEDGRIKSGLLPVDKLNYIKWFKKELSGVNSDLEAAGFDDSASDAGSEVEKKMGLFVSRGNVLMVGDGVNDAPALACSDVGVAMASGGAAIAMETADVALMDSDIAKLVYCIKMGKSVVRVIKQNLVFSLLVKVVVIGLVMGGYGNLWLAIGSDVGAMLCVTLNGMRLLPKKDVVDVKELKGGARKAEGRGEVENSPLLAGGERTGGANNSNPYSYL